VDLGPANVVVAAKLPKGLASELQSLADSRGMTKSAIIKTMVESVVDGTTEFPSVADIEKREAARANARLRESLRRQVEVTQRRKANRQPFGLHRLILQSLERDRERARRKRSRAERNQ
jgi:predicted DNA-binding protein